MGTFLGGSNADYAGDVAVDAAGNSYVTGSTLSPDFPTTPGAYDTTYNGGIHPQDVGDAFLAKFNSAGALVFSTFLGGSSGDGAGSIALDSLGYVYVAGSTSSSDFPTTPGAFDATFSGGDAFVAKFDSSGNLLYSTFLGGSERDGAASIAVDSSGNVYVFGSTESNDFPVTPGAFAARSILTDLFVAKLEPEGTALVYSTVIGGENHEEPSAIALDESGNAYLAGTTYSHDFPVTPDAFDPTFDLGISYGGEERYPIDAFLSKLNSDATVLGYSTFIGGDVGVEETTDMVADSLGNVYVTGWTDAPDFPQTPSAYTGPGPAFFAGFDPAGVIIYAKANFAGSPTGIALDESGNFYSTGGSTEGFWTTPGAFDSTPNGGSDAFVTKARVSSPTFLEYSTFLGGGDQVWLEAPDPGRIHYADDEGTSLAVDPSGNVTVVGATGSWDFPVTEKGYDPTYNGRGDAFVIRIEPVPEPNRTPVAYLDVVPPEENNSWVFVDASESVDAEDRDLVARWDWEDDGVWDTAWSTVKTAWLQFAAPGTYTIRLEVRDTGGLTGDATREVLVPGSPPDAGVVPPPPVVSPWVMYGVPTAVALGLGAALLLRRRSRKGPPRG